MRVTSPRRRAERHADADLVRAPRDGVGEQAVEADRREKKADRREHTREQRDHALGHDRRIELIGERRHFRDGYALQRAANDAAHVTGDGRRRDRRAQRELPPRPAFFLDRAEINRSQRRFRQILVFRGCGDPDDFVDALDAVEAEMPADRVPAGEVVAREGIVDDCDARPIVVFAPKVAAREERRPERLEVPRRDPIQWDEAAIVRLLLRTLRR